MPTTIDEANRLLRDAVESRLGATLEATGENAAGFARGPCPGGNCHREHPGSLPFLELVEELRQLHLRKSQDYGTRSDPLANVRNAADLIGIAPWRAGLVRVAEKVQRIRAFCHNGHLANEGVLDSLMDLAAYSLIVAVLFKEADAKHDA